VGAADLGKDPSEVAEMFDATAKRYDLMNSLFTLGNDRIWRMQMNRAVAAQPGERILDVAAGTGTSSAPMAKAGALVTALDFSEGMIAEGRRRYPEIEFVHGDAQDLPFDDETFDAVVLKSDKPVVVDYWADWCGPCKQVGPIIEELANQHGDKVTFVKMDTNTNPVTPANNHVLGLPTIQVYVNGEVVKAFKGAKSKSTLLNALEEYL